MEKLTVPMSEVNTLVAQVVNNPDYALDMYGADIQAVVDAAVEEQVPAEWNETTVDNFCWVLRSELAEPEDDYIARLAYEVFENYK